MKNDEGTTLQIINYPIELIDPSPYQVRERFEPETLAELADSVREHGIIQPLTARESPLDVTRLELIAGERRLRAGKLAGRQTVPVIIHVMDDAAAQEIVLIENLQREDLTVREEARGYQKALNLRTADGHAVYTLASLCAKISKTESHVRDRLKLLLCPDSLVDAVEEGVIALSTAMLVGRIPEAKARVEAAKKVLHPDIQEVPLNYEQTREMIREQFMVSLNKPGFDIESAELLPVVMEGEVRVMGGSCIDCPFCLTPESVVGVRNSAGLGAEGKITKQGQNDLCTMPSCFRKKQDAAWALMRRAAADQNLRVIEGDGAREIFRSWGNGLNSDAPWVKLDEQPEYDEIGTLSYDNKKKWGTLLKGTDVEIVIARHPTTGQRVELVDKKTAKVIALAKLKNKDAAEVVKDLDTAAALKKDNRKEELRKQKLEAITLHEGLTDLAEAIGRKGMDADQLSYLFQVTLDNSGADGFKIMKDWLALKLPKGTASSARDYEAEIIKTVTEHATTPQQLQGYIVVATLAKTLRWSGLTDEDLVHFWGLYGIKPEQLQRRAVAILDAGTKAKPVETGPSEREIVTGVQDTKQESGLEADFTDQGDADDGGIPQGGSPLMDAALRGMPTGLGRRSKLGMWPVEDEAEERTLAGLSREGLLEAAGEPTDAWLEASGLLSDDHYFHCDGCGQVCATDEHAADVAALPEGTFKCSHCGDSTRFGNAFFYPVANQDQWEKWTPANPPVNAFKVKPTTTKKPAKKAA